VTDDAGWSNYRVESVALEARESQVAPTNPTASNHGPVKHSVLVVVSPAGGKTFSAQCSAGDFSTDEVFESANAAKWSKGINEHVDRNARPNVRRRW